MAGGLTGVTNLIERNFEIAEHDLEIHEINGQYCPRDSFSGMIFLHDFGSRHEYWDNYADCYNAMNDGMQESLRLYAKLGAKTRSLLSYDDNVSLVFHGASSSDSFNALHRLLADKYKKNFLIINILEEGLPATASGPFSLTRYVRDSQGPKQGTPSEWEGCDESWAKALSSVQSYSKRSALFEGFLSPIFKIIGKNR
ncbi:hypothetical protein ACLBX9_12710 [Methylobacterium sp. A49B]